MKTTNPHKNKIEISKQEFENSLFSLFGLKVDYSMVCKYIDTFDQNKDMYNIKSPKVFTVDFIDNTGFGWANINSDFYKKQCLKQTQLKKDFWEFKCTYTFKYKDYWLT